jgi:hypothetical protein
MLHMAKLTPFKILIVGFAITTSIPALAQGDDSPDKDNASRGVRIIAAPTPTSAPTSPDNALPHGSTPSSATTEPTAPTLIPSSSATKEPTTPAATLAPSSAAPASTSPGAASSAPAGDGAIPIPITNPPTAASLEGLSKNVQVANSAELTVEILPGPQIALDSQVSFRITTKKVGYLILIDVDPTGRLTQIYPNPMSLIAKSSPESKNLIRPGKPIQLPDPHDLSGFEFVAAPPFGTAMIVAFLSDRPVQIIDLPDLPSTILGSASAADQLQKLANELRIPDPSGGFQEAHWSMDVKFYAIK